MCRAETVVVQHLRLGKVRRGRGARARSRSRSSGHEIPSACAMDVDKLGSPNIHVLPVPMVEQKAQNFEQEGGNPSEMEELISALAKIFTPNTAVAGDGQGLTRFHGVCAPPITIDAYLARLHKYFDCSDCCLLTSLIYVDRVIKLHPAFPICERTIHRIIAASLMLSAKFHDDIFYSNVHYAKVCGLSLKEINALESELLKLLHWKCDVSRDEYEEYRSRIMVICR